MAERKVLANWIMAPDGTMLPSFHRHDYREHTTVDTYKLLPKEQRTSGQSNYTPVDTRYSMVDGGTDYLRRGGKYTEMTVYDDDPFEVIRRFLCRGSRGENSDEPITWIPLFRMTNEHLKACIKYNQDRNIRGHNKWYAMELDYRENGLKFRRLDPDFKN